MNLRNKRKELHGVVGTLGMVAFLGWVFGEFYSLGMALFLSVAIWTIGATLVNVFTDPD